uniref:NADH-ubiquinone oxidoreductase chain 1 n=1 Tax=Terebellides stroemii TaxID=1037239 RepID=B3TJX6_9ANNE|nr:NADH dehydrogenase subunit 1 [Terebellides stroemii]ABW76482.1 NADH dehydrogenase subunit 1 [Terebellides stroemii]
MNIPFILSIVISYLMAMLAMAFYTLLERKALGYFQLRKGPNKVGLGGIPQPFADAMKLFTKEQTKPKFANMLPYIIAPMTSLILALLLWSLYPFKTPAYFIKFSILLFLCISSINVYTTLGAGWASNSKYALLGAMRSVAQTISYEVSMSLILLTCLLTHYSFSMSHIYYSKSSWTLLCLMPIFFSWFISRLAETNRTPFDLAEGESELVSGFNTEYSSGSFALIFMAEYANILVMSLFSVIFFTSQVPPYIITEPMLILKTMTLAFLFIWIRASFPRMRYDRLMNLTWKTFLPLSLSSLILSISLMKLSL